jgi:hypothetical protein
MLPFQSNEEGVNNCYWKIPIKVHHLQEREKPAKSCQQILSPFMHSL